MERVFKLLPDTQDDRDYLYKAVMDVPQRPIRTSLRGIMPPVFEQENLGSCQSNAYSAVTMALIYFETGQMPPYLSRLDHYWYSRDLLGNTDLDAGASLRDGCKVLLNRGIPPEDYWPYITSKFREKPPVMADEHAGQFKISEYNRIMDLDALRMSLSIVKPVVLGIQIFESFMSNAVQDNGIVPMPIRDTEMRFGGHAVVAVGYDDERQVIECRNSWGSEWGDRGYFTLPYDFIRDMSLTNDMWSISIDKAVPPNPTYQDITFDDALKILKDSGAVTDFTPEFWKQLCDKFKADPAKYDDFRYVDLLIRKFAASML